MDLPNKETRANSIKHGRVTRTSNSKHGELDEEDQMDGVSDQSSKQEYTLTGVLDFLQKSWVQFELERARWNAEKSELQV